MNGNTASEAASRILYRVGANLRPLEFDSGRQRNKIGLGVMAVSVAAYNRYHLFQLSMSIRQRMDGPRQLTRCIN